MLTATAVVALIAITMSIASSGLGVSLPPSGTIAREKGLSEDTDFAARDDGREFRVVSVAADPEQVVLTYTVTGNESDGAFVTILPRPRLILADGSILQMQWNVTSPETHHLGGSLVFPPVPKGKQVVRLELDGLDFASHRLAKRIELGIEIDNEAAYEQSRSVRPGLELGEGPGRTTLDEISVTPSIIVLRGTFDGLTRADMEVLGVPTYALINVAGKRITAESGRRGLGEAANGFELRFPNDGLEGQVTLELNHGAPLRGGGAVMPPESYLIDLP